MKSPGSWFLAFSEWASSSFFSCPSKPETAKPSAYSLGRHREAESRSAAHDQGTPKAALILPSRSNVGLP